MGDNELDTTAGRSPIDPRADIVKTAYDKQRKTYNQYVDTAEKEGNESAQAKKLYKQSGAELNQAMDTSKAVYPEGSFANGPRYAQSHDEHKKQRQAGLKK